MSWVFFFGVKHVNEEKLWRLNWINAVKWERKGFACVCEIAYKVKSSCEFLLIPRQLILLYLLWTQVLDINLKR